MAPESFEATSPISNRTTKIIAESSQPMGGGVDTKSRIEAYVQRRNRTFWRKILDQLKGKKGRKISLVERDIPVDRRDDVVELWKHFKEAGLPVVPTLRITSKGTLVATDMKADGSEIYGSWANTIPFALENKRKSGLNEVDLLFIKNYPQIRDEILSKATEVAELATANKITLPMDDPLEIIFHPDGTWEPIVLDLYLADKIVDDSQASLDKIKGENAGYIRVFKRNLDSIYRKLNEMLPDVS